MCPWKHLKGNFSEEGRLPGRDRRGSGQGQLKGARSTGETTPIFLSRFSDTACSVRFARAQESNTHGLPCVFGTTSGGIQPGAYTVAVSLFSRELSFSVKSFLEARPTTRSTTCPPLKKSSVGIERIPYWEAVVELASTSTFPTLARPWNSLANSSTVGAIRCHGEHHSAQKSTITSSELPITSD